VRLRRDGLSWRRSGEEVIVLDLRTSRYLSLNGTGALLWEQLAAADRTTAELAGLLRDRHGIAVKAATTDVEAFVADLRAQALLDDA
jgi:hypothetical protein